MNELIVAGIAFLGTTVGTAGGIIASSKLTNFRLAQLEKKVDKHNSVIERTFVIESQLNVIDEKIKVVNHRVSDLEEMR